MLSPRIKHSYVLPALPVPVCMSPPESFPTKTEATPPRSTPLHSWLFNYQIYFLQSTDYHLSRDGPYSSSPKPQSARAGQNEEKTECKRDKVAKGGEELKDPWASAQGQRCGEFIPPSTHAGHSPEFHPLPRSGSHLVPLSCL